MSVTLWILCLLSSLLLVRSDVAVSSLWVNFTNESGVGDFKICVSEHSCSSTGASRRFDEIISQLPLPPTEMSVRPSNGESFSAYYNGCIAVCWVNFCSDSTDPFCSCSEDCNDYNDCCHDLYDGTKIPQQKFECVTHNFLVNPFLAVTSCFDDFADGIISEKCRTPVSRNDESYGESQ